MHRLLGQPVGFRARDRRVQIRELLHGDVVAVHERDGLVLLPVALQPGFGGLDFLALLGEPRAEPVVRLLRRHEPVLEVLLDVVPGQRVDDARRQRRIRMPILDVHQPAVADGRDGQLRCEGIDGPRLRSRLVNRGVPRRVRPVSPLNRPAAAPAHQDGALEGKTLIARPAERRRVPQAETVERAARQRAALQHVVLGLVVVRLGLIFVDHLLEVDDVLLLGLEEQPGPGFVDGRRREGVDGDGADDERECRERRPAPLVEHLDVVDQVGLGTLVHLGVAGRGHGRRAGLRGRLRRRQFGHGGSLRRPSGSTQSEVLARDHDGVAWLDRIAQARLSPRS